MKETVYHISRRVVLPLIMLAAVMLHSSRQDELVLPEPATETSGAIVVSAVVGGNDKVSRSIYIHNPKDDTISVVSGEFSFTYLKPRVGSGTDPSTAVCRIVDGLGYVYPEDAYGQPLYGAPLQWTHLLQNQPATFILDNVDERDVLAETEDGKNYTFVGPDWQLLGTKYDAAIESESSTNDVVWGSANVAYGTHTYSEEKIVQDPQVFSLTHRMSRINVVVTNVSKETVDNSLPVTVELSNLVTHPWRFNRVTGDVELPEVKEYRTCTFFDGQAGQTDCWAKNTDDENYTLTTANLILPPDAGIQSRVRDEIPVLTVRVGDKTYSATIPSSMIYEKDNYAVGLWFRPAHHLTLRVRLSPKDANPTIEFLPVVVRKWEDVGTYIVNGTPQDPKKRGVHSQEDFDRLVRLYNSQKDVIADVTDISYELLQYGTYTWDIHNWSLDDKFRLAWTFDIQTDGLVLNEEFSKDLFRGIYPMELNFNGHNMDGKTSAAEVVDVGVHNIEELNACIELLNGGNYPEAFKYGSYRYTGDVATSSFRVDILADIAETPNSKFIPQGFAFEIDFHGHTVGGFSSTEDFIYKEPGVYSQDDLAELIRVVNLFIDTNTVDKALSNYAALDGTVLYVKLFSDVEVPSTKFKDLSVKGYEITILPNGHKVGDQTDAEKILQLLSE